MSHTLALFTGGIGWQEIILLALVALLIFGKRLPEVGKSLGKGIVEFKKGLSGIEDNVKQAGSPGAPTESTSTDTPSPQINQTHTIATDTPPQATSDTPANHDKE